MSTPTATGTEARAESRALTVTDWGLLIVRLALGVIFFAHGAQKVFGWFGGHGLANTVQFFSANLGIPAPLTYLAAFTELLGGLAVLIGALSRLAALGLTITMLVAIFKVHLANGFFLSQGAGDGIEYNLALIALSLMILLAGPGRLALGDWEPRLLRKR